MINLDLEKQISNQIEQAINNYLNSDELKTKIQQQVDSSIGTIIERVASRVYTDVVNKSDISTHIKDIVVLEASTAIRREANDTVRTELGKVSVKDILESVTKKEIGNAIKSMDFPPASIDPESIKWRKGAVSGNSIRGGTIQDFNSIGIEDKATSVQLTVLDDNVVVENQFTALNITAADTITATNLSLTGTLEIGTEIIDHGPFSQMIQMHAEMMADQALEPYKPLLVNGEAVIQNNTLNPSVQSSNLRKVGNLQDLTVIGDAKFSETVFISAGGKVGINTEEPRGALTVWDQDAEVSLSRTGRQTMYFGSTRPGVLEVGVNNQAQIVFNQDIIDIKQAVRLLGIKFSVLANVPEHLGEINELVFVSTAREGQPILYICRGGNKWQALG